MTTTNTLERIRWERKRVQKELEHLEQVIADDFHELTAPPQQQTRGNDWCCISSVEYL